MDVTEVGQAQPVTRHELVTGNVTSMPRNKSSLWKGANDQTQAG